MNKVFLVMALICLLSNDGRAAEHEVMSLAEAANLEGKDDSVTVEFVVKSWHAVLPDGREVRLLSESSFKHKDAFVVHLTEDAVAKIGAEDVEDYFLGKTIRVTGKVTRAMFSSSSEIRPGILVDVPPSIKAVTGASDGH